MKTPAILKACLLACACLFLSQSSWSQLVDIVVEPVITHGSEPYPSLAGDVSLEGYVTYRVYAVVADPADYVNAVFGDGAMVTHLDVDGVLYQNPFGSGVGININPLFYPVDEALVYDSWLTIGAEDNSASPGTVTAIGGNDTDDDFVETFETEGSFELSGLTGGLWFTLNDVNGLGTPDENNRVLLAQLTVNGSFSGTWWMQAFIDGDGSNENIDVFSFASNGCTDPTACNYFPNALEDDGSCCYGVCGCMDEAAYNFNPDAECPLYNCTYELVGYVWDDLNADGVWDEDELPLPYMQVTVETLGLTFITNDFGKFETGVVEGFHELTVATNIAFPFVTTPNPQSIALSSIPSEPLYFGLSHTMPVGQICVDFYPNAIPFLCNDFVNHNICYRNMGNTTIDGYVVVEYDPIFQGYEEATPIDSVVGNKVYMGFEDLNPGQMFFYDLILHSPTVDFIGEFATHYCRAVGFDENGNQVAMGEETLEVEIQCAYDPNDKQVFPNGYTDDHLVLNDTELEYLVRFQNTGNAPAIDVLLRDTLDANLDLSTFQLMANSHSVITTLDETTREVTFFFEDIMLPDSTCCEEDSHGLVSYLIRPLPDLDPGTVIENTAYIYFDNNPPIITNTTWNTIHACDYTIELTAENIVDCPGAATEISTDYNFDIDWESQFSWTLDGVEVGTDSTLILNPYFSTSETFFLTVNNPLCEEYGEDTFSFDLDFNWATCTGDLNCDGDVDAKDMLAFLGDYACNGILCRFDLDGDAAVNSEDLMVVLGAFGTACE